jgi:tRNA(Ile)-lysidine synthase
LALAVSGGSDSVALMVLFADWLRQLGENAAQHTVITVDHRLRPSSGAEARMVTTHATGLGFRHAVLDWHGPKPQAGLQAAAREARYQLMARYLAAHGMTTLLVAHTQEDQAETLMMRLARGSGLDGLAAMAPSRHFGLREGCRELRIVRPLLSVSKTRLRATLRERGVAWIEDPSNAQAAFERTRWRAALGDLQALGLSRQRLALSARRLQRARAALEAITDDYCAEECGLVRTNPVGGFSIDRQRLSQAPEEIALRLIGRCIGAAGGLPEPVPLAGLEPIVSGVWESKADGAWTLARAQIKAAGATVEIEREPGRLPLPVLDIAAGSKLVWDGRFTLEVAPGWEGPLKVRALGPPGLAELRRLRGANKASSALLLTPSFWRGEELLAVPTVAFWAHPGWGAMMSAQFKGLSHNLSPRTSRGAGRGGHPCYPR